MNSEVILVGAFHETIELCEQCGVNVVGIYDNIQRTEYHGCEILGDDRAAESASAALKRIPIILSPDSPAARRRLAGYYCSIGFRLRSLIGPSATISRSAVIGAGVLIQNGCNVSSNAQIGDCVRLNTRANVMHDSVVGNFTTIAPNAVVLGRVVIGEQCYIGANSTVLPNKKLGGGSVVGAGAVVTKDVNAGLIMVGVPARDQMRKKGILIGASA